MGESFILRKGGTAASFALLGVTYPSGSTCICTDGSTTLSASNTNGQALFNIPSAGTWTVTATEGTKSTSESVEITTEGQFVSVELIFALVLYNNGTQNVAWAAYDGSGDNYATFKSGYMSIIPNGYMPYFYTKNKVSTAGYSTLKIEYKSRYSRGKGFSFGTSNDSDLGGGYEMNFVSKSQVLDQSETKKTASCSITSGSFNILIESGYEDQEYGDSAYIYIYKVWLE